MYTNSSAFLSEICNFRNLLNHGNAINFINNAVVGPFIYLVQAEIIHAVWSIISGNYNLWEDYTILDNEKQYIADIWLKYFNY